MVGIQIPTMISLGLERQLSEGKRDQKFIDRFVIGKFKNIRIVFAN